MGDRRNIMFNDGEGVIYLYTHWEGTKLPETLKFALLRGEDRWDDPAYLCRIIFSEMIQENVMGNTGFGISTFICESNPKRDITVDCNKQTVQIGLEDPVSFKEYCNG